MCEPLHRLEEDELAVGHLRSFVRRRGVVGVELVEDEL
jgi:hypothetical protein